MVEQRGACASAEPARRKEPGCPDAVACLMWADCSPGVATNVPLCHCRWQVPDVEQFMATYNMQCPMAAHRLKKGIPATLDYDPAPRRDQASSAIAVAETVQVCGW